MPKAESVGGLMEHALKFAPFKDPTEGYMVAKRQMQDALDRRVTFLRSELRKCRKESNYAGFPILMAEINLVEDLRDYVRNGMLWNSEWGK